MSYIDVNDNFSAGLPLATQPSAVAGGKQASFPLGLNRYVNSNIRFILDDDPKGVLVAVRDSAPRVGKDGLDRLFDAFYATKPHALDMGLAISDTIIGSHGGRLWASPNVPCGAIFQFNLPIDGEEAPSSNQPRSPSKPVIMQ
jgi:hypothetical protein